MSHGTDETDADDLVGHALELQMMLRILGSSSGKGYGAQECRHVAIQAIDKILKEIHPLRAALMTEHHRGQAAFMAELDEKYGPIEGKP